MNKKSKNSIIRGLSAGLYGPIVVSPVVSFFVQLGTLPWILIIVLAAAACAFLGLLSGGRQVLNVKVPTVVMRESNEIREPREGPEVPDYSIKQLLPAGYNNRRRSPQKERNFQATETIPTPEGAWSS